MGIENNIDNTELNRLQENENNKFDLSDSADIASRIESESDEFSRKSIEPPKDVNSCVFDESADDEFASRRDNKTNEKTANKVIFDESADDEFASHKKLTPDVETSQPDRQQVAGSDQARMVNMSDIRTDSDKDSTELELYKQELPDNVKQAMAGTNQFNKVENNVPFEERDTKTDHIEELNKPERLTTDEEKQVKDFISPHFEKAQDIAHNATTDGTANGEKDYKGENFTDHNKEHIEQVLNKTTEATDAFVEAINKGKMETDYPQGDVRFNADVDYKVIQAAALSHDTGMSDDGYSKAIDADGNMIVEKQNRYDFNSVRGNHNVNSALNVLENREQYKEIGFTDNQVDEISVLCYEHSKSSSGISNLNDSSAWKEGFDRLDTFVEVYNKDHPDTPISYDREHLESRMGALATEGLALRVGDASRDSGPDSVSQGGNTVHVDCVADGPASSYKSEINNYSVIRDDGYEITDEKSKQVHIGEQNIVDNHTVFKDGAVTHTITVADGNYAPYCTAEAIKDHLGEFASAKDGQFVVSVEFDKPCSVETQDIYNTFRREVCDDYSIVHILYSWDKED